MSNKPRSRRLTADQFAEALEVSQSLDTANRTIEHLTRQRDEAIRERDELRAMFRWSHWRPCFDNGHMLKGELILTPDQHAALFRLVYPQEDSTNA